ncbi:uncharacterized protein EKO05_0005110 [Ascochyta rabiei]|uniref:uncharacterized protein n=1 Tax=Didymella rabiei TaxID=5454 RepID=UPI0021FD13B3|nr:uncharacterized protein EKO05_0005110 [Ascochyta rabiei]UPX14633.1 hypothetical protein EKO05_0005110 [Ascochyta rabiei]
MRLSSSDKLKGTMTQASASVTMAKRQKVLMPTIEGYSSNWDRTRLSEEIRHRTETEEDEKLFSCLEWLRSYITTCFTNTTPRTPATKQLPVSSEEVAGKHIALQAAWKISVLRPGQNGKYLCSQCSGSFSCVDLYIFHPAKRHEAETPSGLLIPHYKLSDSKENTAH